MGLRAEKLAGRIRDGANALAAFAEGLDDAQWATPVPGDGRAVGVVVHHVAASYPIEVQLAQALASGNAIEGVTMSMVHEMNAQHASDNGGVKRADAIQLLRSNSSAAADAIQGISDAQLDSASPVSLNADAPLTAQFFIEDHALRHSFHHLEKIKAAVGK